MSVFGRVVIYAKDVEASIAFYEETFGFVALRDPSDRIVELNHPDGGGVINLHPAAKSQKMGQVLVKLVFDVRDVEGVDPVSLIAYDKVMVTVDAVKKFEEAFA